MLLSLFLVKLHYSLLNIIESVRLLNTNNLQIYEDISKYSFRNLILLSLIFYVCNLKFQDITPN